MIHFYLFCLVYIDLLYTFIMDETKNGLFFVSGGFFLYIPLLVQACLRIPVSYYYSLFLCSLERKRRRKQN